MLLNNKQLYENNPNPKTDKEIAVNSTYSTVIKIFSCTLLIIYIPFLTNSQGGVKFPTGGKYRFRYQPASA